MKKIITEIFSNIGIGTSHVINKDNIICIKRYGFWTPYLTIFFSKIIPLKEYNIKQLYHSHQGNFFSIILWGSYREEVLFQEQVYQTENNWFSYHTHNEHHKVTCDSPCYTLFIMGKRKCQPTVRLKQGGRMLKHERFFTIND